MLDQYGMGAVSMAIILNEENLALKAENALLSERVKELDEKLERHKNAARGYYSEWDKKKAALEKRIEELNRINESDKFQYQKLCDKLYSVKKELEARKQHEKELEESFKLLTSDYLELKAEKKSIIVIKGGCKNGKG